MSLLAVSCGSIVASPDAGVGDDAGTLSPDASTLSSDAGTLSPDAGPIERACALVGEATSARQLRCGVMHDSIAQEAANSVAQRCTSGAQGRVTASASGLQLCLDELAGSCLVPSVRCQGEQLFTGTVGLDEPCFNASECQASFFCDNTTTCPARCALRLPVGQQVSAEQSLLKPCVEGAYVFQGVCSPLVAAGGSCASQPGVGSPSCALPNRCLSGVCGIDVLAGAGQACVPGTCGEGLFCDDVTSTCRPTPRLGEPCGPAAQCQWGLQCATGHCEPYPELGAACTSESGCRDGLCVAGTCVARRGLSESCTSWSDCAEGLLCAYYGKRCQGPGTVGATCHFSGECRSDLFCAPPAPGHVPLCTPKLPDGSACIGGDCVGECHGASGVMRGICGQPYCRAP